MYYIHHVILTAITFALIWMFNKTKQIYNRLYKRNSKIPDVDVIKKILPISKVSGWKVDTVHNGMPIWKYLTSFTFSPHNLYATRALITTNSLNVLKELVDIKQFSALFPGLPKLKCESKSTTNNHSVSNKDVLSLSNMNPHLSLINILRNKGTAFNLERFWFCEPKSAWLYMCPTTSLFTHHYGYWICFCLQDLEDSKNSLLHIMASFPSSMKKEAIWSLLSSCTILTKDHMEIITPINKNIKPKTESFQHVNKKIIFDETKFKQSQSSPQLQRRSINLNQDSKKEVRGYEEEPAEINTISNEVLLNEQNVVEKEESLVTSSPNKPEGSDGMHENVNNAADSSSEYEYITDDEDPYKDYELDSELVPLKEKLQGAFDVVLDAYESNEHTPGWEVMGSKDGVKVYKKSDNVSAYSSLLKGVTTVHGVPFHYILHYATNLEFKPEYDSLFEQGSDVQVFKDGLTKITNLIFHNVWPTTGRDFVSITGLRHLKDNLYGIAVKAHPHPDCPPRKNKVRGEIVSGGFVFNIVSTDPHEVEVTYIARAEMKGSIPQRIIDKVSAQQPYSVGQLRKHCERHYKENNPPRDTGRETIDKIHSIPSVYKNPPRKKIKRKKEKKSNILVKESENEKSKSQTINENVESNSDNEFKGEYNDKNEKIKDDGVTEKLADISKTPNTETSTVAQRTTKESDSNDNNDVLKIEENFFSESQDEKERQLNSLHFTTDDEISINSDITQISEDYTSQLSVSEQELELPRDSSGHIDFITLGNQTAAALEEEYFIAFKRIEELKMNPDIGGQDGEWTFQGTNRDVIIMRKVHPNQKFHSFLGRGVIHVLPITVWEAIKTPQTRFMYDNMLKKSDVIKVISDRHKIVHMRHETSACFIKQARDFCVLTVERVEEQRYVLAATSVDIPECPVEKDCVRAKVISSGWIIEPFKRNGRPCAKVTYISQVNFGGRLPTRLINLIAKRQPLAVAYLREYLECSEI